MKYLVLLCLMLSSKVTYAWVSDATGGDEDLPILCVSQSGKQSVYTNIYYQVQARYHTWVAEWSMLRAHHYPRDESIGLLMTEKVRELLQTSIRLGTHTSLLSIIQWSKTKPLQFDTGRSMYESICQFHSLDYSDTYQTYIVVKIRIPALKDFDSIIVPSILKRLKVIAQNYPQMYTNSGWLIWRFINPYQDLNGHAEQMVQQIKKQIESVTQHPKFMDKNFHTSEKGDLQLYLPKPAKIWINDISYGILAQQQRIPLAEGFYTIYAQTLDKPPQTYEYENVEVVTSKLTRFRLLLK